MNQADLELIARKLPISDATRKRNQAGAMGPSAADPKSAQRLSLERVHKGKETSGNRTVSGHRWRILFRIYAVRPADADAHHVKELIDGLVALRLMESDSWKCLESVTTSSHKVHAKIEERTEIEMIPL